MIPEYELRQMYCDEHMSQREIAEKIGVNRSKIVRMMKSCGIKARTISKSMLVNSVKPSIDILKEMYNNNPTTQVEIAKAFGVGKSTVSIWMKEYEIDTHAISKSKLIKSRKPSKKEIVEMYLEKEMSKPEIAKEIGVSTSTIRNWMNEYEIESRTISEAKLNDNLVGEKSGGWKGGISFEPYCHRFNNTFKESVRERDGYTCQLCGYKQNSQKLDVHHIHYDKKNCYPDVVALCRSCNSRVNSDRDYWEGYFENQLSERGLCCWSLSQET